MIIKSTNAFSFIKMKFCSNLKDTMYFLSFCLRQNKDGGRGQKGNGTCLYFPLGVILKSEVNN